MAILSSSQVQGPTDTPYHGGVFELSITVPEQYPLVPPVVKFKTRLFHPNVHFKASEAHVYHREGYL